MKLFRCPFCGEQALMGDDGEESLPERYFVYCSNDDCFVAGTRGYESEFEAADVWNTRYHETCHIILRSSEVSVSGIIAKIPTCSVCGETIPDGSDACPGCGSSVIHEGNSKLDRW